MIPVEQILALCCGDLDAADADAVEEHLLACDACSGLADRFAAIGRGIAGVVRDGQGRGTITRATAEHLRELRLPIGEYRIPAGGSVQCRLAPGDVLNMVTLEVPATGPGRIDSVLLAADGREIERAIDIPLDRTAGTLTLIESRQVLRALPTARLTLRLLEVDADRTRTLSEYGFDHHATD
jgi:hypothetical protein